MRNLWPNLLALLVTLVAIALVLEQPTALRTLIARTAHRGPACPTMTETRKPKPLVAVPARPGAGLAQFDFAVPGWVAGGSGWPSNDGSPTPAATTPNHIAT